MQLLKNIFLTISLTFSSLYITGCGEADYSLEQVRAFLEAENLVGGSVVFNTPTSIIVNDQQQNIIIVSTDTSENMTYSIIGGAAQDILEINTVTGALGFIDVIDYIEGESNTYEVIVAVTSASGVISSHTMSIEVVEDITEVEPLVDYVAESVQAVAGSGVITQIRARPADITGNVVYSIVERDAEAFEIDENGNLSFTEPLPNFEATPDREYQLAVVVTDGYGNSVTTPIIIVVLVNNLDEVKPVVETANITIIENSLGAFPIVVSANGNGVVDTFILGGTDADAFELSAEGILSFKEARDYEVLPRTFSITIKARDDLGNESDTKTITVNVSDMDEKFTFTNIQNYTPLVGDKVIGNIVVEENTIVSGDLEYIVVEGDDLVEIDNNGKLQFKNVGQTTQNFTVKISVESQVNGSLTYSTPFNVTVIADSSQVLPSISNTYLRSKNVRTPIDTAHVVAAIHGTANGSSTTISYTLEGADASKFRVDILGNIYFNASYDYYARSDANADNVYEVMVRITDNNNNSVVTETISVRLEEDLNAIAPVVTSSTFSVQENGIGNLIIQSRTDGNGVVDSISISGGNDAALFKVVNDRLAFKNAPDFETPASSLGTNSYRVAVKVHDNLGNVSAEKILIITVADMNEKFTFTNIRNFTSLVNDKVIGQISVEANTIVSGHVEYAVVEGADIVEIDSSGTLQFKALALINQNFSVSISVQSQLKGSLSISDPFNITVTADQSLITPSISDTYLHSSNVGSPIDTTQVITTINASPRGSSTSITYSLQGSDASKFRVDASGNLYFNASHDYYSRSDVNADNVYEVKVRVTDNNSNSVVTQTIRVTLLEDLTAIAPVVTSNTFSVQENSTGSLTLTSRSDGTGIVDSYSISGGDDATLFKIVNGKLTFKAAPDFEAAASLAGTNTYRVAVQAHDNFGNDSASKTLSVSVGNIDETLSFTGLQSYSQTAGVTVLGAMTASPNMAMSATIAYSIGTGSATFSINASTGVIMFKNAPVFNLSGSNSYTLTVIAQSQYNGSRSESSTITVTVMPSSYAITFDSDQSSIAMDHSTSVSFPMTASSAAGKSLSYSVENTSLAGVFSIDDRTGTLSINAPAYNFSGINRYTAEVVARDNEGHSARRLGTLTVNSVDGTPVFNTDATLTVDENENIIATLSATSPIGSSLTYDKVLGMDSYDFDVAANGQLSFSYAKNFEDPEDDNADNIYEVDVRVTDALNSSNTVVKRFSVRVVDVSELPNNLKFDHVTDQDKGFIGSDNVYIRDPNSAYIDVESDGGFIGASNKNYRVMMSAQAFSGNTLSYSIISGINVNGTTCSISGSGEMSIYVPKKMDTTNYNSMNIKVCEEDGECNTMTVYLKVVKE